MNERAITEAAERVRRVKAGEAETAVYPARIDSVNSTGFIRDYSALAEFAIAHLASQRAAEEEGEKLRELLSEVAHSGIEYTADGKYHVVQIDVDTWREIQALQPTKRPA